MYGYRGVILRVDLTREAVTRHPLDPALARDYLGGGASTPKRFSTR